MKRNSIHVSLVWLLATAAGGGCAAARGRLRTSDETGLDATRAESSSPITAAPWPDMNVPEVDGQTLYDIIVARKYTRALEIGTSTGHSGIWIAWALSKTGGTLITHRHRRAASAPGAGELRSSRRGAVHRRSRLGDAHVLVPALEGPFDFVFSDADKEWYRNYFDALLPKLRGAAASRRTTCRPDRADGTTSTTSTC